MGRQNLPYLNPQPQTNIDMKKNLHDAVNHPKHYTAHPSGVECIQITRHMNFCLGNAMKYIWRAGLKGDAVEDKELKNTIRQYLMLKDELDVITKRQNDIKQRLIEVVDAVEADDRGHRVLTVEDDSLGDVTLTRQRRVSKSLNMEVAEDILTKKGIRDTCIKMVPTIDEGAIMAAFYENYLTEEDIDAMFPSKISYAFLLDK